MFKRIEKSFLFLTLLCLFSASSLLAQDAHFAQFYKAPQLLNPALTGVFSGQFRFNANYRDQWSSILGSNPFRTVHAGVDFKFASIGNDFFGLGFHAMNDQAGNGHFQQNRAYLSGAYAKQISGAGYSGQGQFLIAGGQFGVGQNSLDWNRLWFSDQFDRDAGLPNIDTPTTEPWNTTDQGNSPLFLDFNAGLLWFATWAKNSALYIGGSLNHLNNPVISLVGADERLDLRWLIHAGGQIPISQRLSVLPGLMIQRQGSRGATSFGANFRYSNNDWNEMAIRAGIWPHFSSKSDGGFHLDEWTTTLILEWLKWDFGISYGINTSSLKSATLSRGAYELSILYTHPGNEKLKTKCPKF